MSARASAGSAVNALAADGARECLSCGEQGVEVFLDLGETPLADRLLKPEELSNREIMVPLRVGVCRKCWLVQITEIVPPHILFGEEYPYYSSVSETLLRHSRSHAERLLARMKLSSASLVLEIASNDGYMLSNFVREGIPVLGVEPAGGPARLAEERGIPTKRAFFGKEVAMGIREDYGAADLVIANNVLAHVPDINGFVEGIGSVLKPDASAVIEVPYLVDLFAKCEFDTMYHQHLCYFSVIALKKLFRRHDLTISAVERIPIHGGSLRICVSRGKKGSSDACALIEEETKTGLRNAFYYRSFAERIVAVRKSLRALLSALKREGKRVAGYGAAAKATTMMSYVGITADDIEFIVDKNPVKHGRYMGGNHIPIHPPSRLLEEMPDVVFLFAWNFSEEILKEQHEYRKKGGRFLIPIPEAKIV